MYKKIIIPALILSLAANGVLGYYLHLAKFDLKCAEDINKQHTKEIAKLNDQISTLLNEKYVIEEGPAKNKKNVSKIDLRNLPYIPMTQRAPEPYIPMPHIQVQSYIPDSKNWYDDAPQHDFKQAQQARDLYRLQNAVEELQERETNRIFKSPLMNETPIGY